VSEKIQSATQEGRKPPLKGARIRVALIITAALFVFFRGWALTYPSPSDPKSIQYTFWKHGLYKMNLDLATGTMIGDANRDKLVIGKTKAQLRDKFGYLLALADASEYLRGCYQSSGWKGADVLFIRQSPWMIVFDNERAKELVLIKGC
jgi:hypothetical protein